MSVFLYLLAISNLAIQCEFDDFFREHFTHQTNKKTRMHREASEPIGYCLSWNYLAKNFLPFLM